MLLLTSGQFSSDLGNFTIWTVLYAQLFLTNLIYYRSFLNHLNGKPNFFNDHMDDTFVEHRRVLLQNYLSNMLGVIEVVRNKDFLVFLGVDA